MARNPPSSVTQLIGHLTLTVIYTWWDHGEVASCLSFGLGPAEPQEPRHDHQALAGELPPLGWLQGGCPVSLHQLRFSDPINDKSYRQALGLTTPPRPVYHADPTSCMLSQTTQPPSILGVLKPLHHVKVTILQRESNAPTWLGGSLSFKWRSSRILVFCLQVMLEWSRRWIEGSRLRPQ